ncbi:MAG: DUF3015 family protein [Thermodesulfobacteriota bacterium]|nr:DUF3015 family protein [Thermodesulfobacteriota bacterium]
MKKITVLVLVICFAATFAYAGTRENTGCGLGSMILEGEDGLLSQTLAATLNGCFGNQTFGITSGTLDCEQQTTLVQNKAIRKFVADNMDSLAKNIAMGHGESLTTLAEMMEIPNDARTEFYYTLQFNFDAIFPAADITPLDVVKNIDKVLKG